MSRIFNSSLRILSAYCALLILVAFAVFSVNSCKTDETCTTPCVFGTCVNNECNCNAGYEGDSCSELTTQKYIANWNASDTCDTNIYNYVATISSSSTIANQFQITNFGRFGSAFVVTANVSGTSFTIPSQNVEGITLSGSGTIDVIDSDDATIFISYFAEDEFHNTDHCSGVWTKAP